MKRIGIWITVFALVFGICAQAGISEDWKKTGEYIQKTAKDAVDAPVDGVWTILALARAGAADAELTDAYAESFAKMAKDKDGILHESNDMEYAKAVLVLTAIGRDPQDFAGYNFVQPLLNVDKIIGQGINAVIYTLLALDAHDYGTDAVREQYIQTVLEAQQADGGFTLFTDSDPDMTAIALQALAPYRDDDAVRSAADRALACLSAMQTADGSFASWGIQSAESTAQVILALCTLGIDLQDERFIKAGNTLLDSLSHFRLENGAYCHAAGESESMVATGQSYMALTAMARMKNSQNSFYDMHDVPLTPKDILDVPQTEWTAPFLDISGHKNEEAIKALYGRELISGMTETEFMPDKTMSRAEFATLITRGFGIAPEPADVFADVPADEWYAGYVGAAYRAGIISGMDEIHFAPEAEISREQAAVMVRQGAMRMGMDTALTDEAVRNILAQFPDYQICSEWAKNAMAFCYGKGILSVEESHIRPKENILRGEVAQMLYNLWKDRQ